MNLKCAMCLEYKPEEEFRYMKNRKRYCSYCRSCERAYHKSYDSCRGKRQRDNIDRKEQKRRAEQQKRLSEIAAEAASHGMSYGQWKAKKYMETMKTNSL